MPSTFLAYIDESGDDGLDKFREPFKSGGASNWLVITACVWRRIYDLEAVAWRNEIRVEIPKKQDRAPIHFTNLSHNQRILAAQKLSSKPLRITSVLAAKKPIPSGIYTTKNQLYFYMTRYLIERLSWLCRDIRPKAPEGDGKVNITFSRRGGMSYPDFQSYLRTLRGKQTKIHWPVIDIDAVMARDHSTSASLQLADIAASAVAAGVEPDMYGNCEPRYAEILRPVVYCRRNNYLSYGMKTVPDFDECGLSSEQMKLYKIFK